MKIAYYELWEVVKMTTKTKRQILLVDDEKIVRESLGEWLTEAGYQVALAEDGEKALRIVAVKDVNVALVDLKLPGEYDGLEVLKKIKEEKDIPVIIITAYGSIENAVEAMKLGAYDYITKPFEPEELEFKIDELVKEIQEEWEKVEEEKVEKEVIQKEIESQLKEGIEYYKKQEYDSAIDVFKKILSIDPTNTDIIKNLRKAERQKEFKQPITLITKKIEEKEKEGKVVSEKQCIWAKAGVVSYRVCTNNFDCATCEFAQSMEDMQGTYGDETGFSAVRKKLLELPADKRNCRYMLSEDVTFKLCPNQYLCQRCEFDQMMQDIKQQKQEELAKKVEKIRKKKLQ